MKAEVISNDLGVVTVMEDGTELANCGRGDVGERVAHRIADALNACNPDAEDVEDAIDAEVDAELEELP